MNRSRACMACLSHLSACPLPAAVWMLIYLTAGGVTVIHYDQVCHKPLQMLDIDRDLFKQLLEQLEENDAEAYSKTIDSLFLQFRNKGSRRAPFPMRLPAACSVCFMSSAAWRATRASLIL